MKGSVRSRRKRGAASGFAVAVACLLAGAIAGPAAARQAGPAATCRAAVASVAAAPSALRAAMVADTGGLDDGGFNHLCHLGLQRAARELGVQTAVLEAKTAGDYATHLETLAARGYSPVFAVGYRMTGAVAQLAPAYPGTTFAGVDIAFDPAAPNVIGLTFKEQEAAYLAGVVAGMLTTRTGVDPRINARRVVGFVGGVKIPPVERFQAGFKDGVRSVAPRVVVRSLYTRSFTDEAAGRHAALSLIRGGADIVFAAAGPAGDGAAAACKNRGALFIGVDADQSETIPGIGDTIVTSAVKRVDTAVFLVLQDAAAGSMQAGVNRVFGLAEDGVGLAPYHLWDKKLPGDITRAVARARAGVVSGDVAVPQAPSASSRQRP